MFWKMYFPMGLIHENRVCDVNVVHLLHQICQFTAHVYLFNVNGRNTRTIRQLCAKVKIKIPEQRR